MSRIDAREISPANLMTSITNRVQQASSSSQAGPQLQVAGINLPEEAWSAPLWHLIVLQVASHFVVVFSRLHLRPLTTSLTKGSSEKARKPRSLQPVVQLQDLLQLHVSITNSAGNSRSEPQTIEGCSGSNFWNQILIFRGGFLPFSRVRSLSPLRVQPGRIFLCSHFFNSPIRHRPASGCLVAQA